MIGEVVETIGFGFAIFGATAALIVNAFVLARVFRKVEDIHAAVRTANSLTLGALADNTEVRRILALAVSERTKEEKEHLVDVERHGQER
jgi:hypothetical protein